MFISVVLPAPFSPSSACTSPRRRSRSMCRSRPGCRTLRDPAELERQVGARARGGGGERSLRALLAGHYLTLLGETILPLTICALILLTLATIDAGTALLIPAMPVPFCFRPNVVSTPPL